MYHWEVHCIPTVQYFLTVLLRYNSHNTIHPFKVYKFKDLICPHCCTSNHYNQLQNISLTLKSCTLCLHPPIFSSLQVSTLPLQICPFLTFHINGIIHYMIFCYWFLSFSIFPRFIHVVVHIGISFYCQINYMDIYIYIYIYHILLIHSSVNGHLGYLHFLVL